jgi:hypothetical protein
VPSYNDLKFKGLFTLRVGSATLKAFGFTANGSHVFWTDVSYVRY